MNRRNINLNDFEKKEKLGKGTYGEVFKIMKRTTNEEYAAKEMIFTNEDKELNKKSINREIKIMSNLIHPTLSKLIGFEVKVIDHEQFQVTIVMELAEKGSLSSIIKTCDNTTRQIILIGIARGMMFLHQNKVIHRDLKPGNILIDGDFKPHISDFGLSKFTKIDSNISDSNISIGTPYYMAPEVIKDESNDVKSDVYSFGIIMFEVLTGKKPYPDSVTAYKLLHKISEENYRPEFPKDFTNESLKNLMRQCWDQNPDNRPTFDEIFNKLAFNHSKNYDLFESDQCYYLDGIDKEKVDNYINDITNCDISQLNNEIVLVHERLEQIEKILIHYFSNKKSKDDAVNFTSMIDDILSSSTKFQDICSKMDEYKKELEDLTKEFKKLNLNVMLTEFKSFKEETLKNLQKLSEQIKNERNDFDTKLNEKFQSIENYMSDLQSRLEEKIENRYLNIELSNNNDDSDKYQLMLQNMMKMFDEKLEKNKKEIEEKFQNEIKQLKDENLQMKNQLLSFGSQKQLKDPTVDDFISASIKSQSFIISQIIKEKSGQKINQNFIYLNELLQYLNKIDQIANIDNCISFHTQNDKQLLSDFYDKNEKINLIILKQVETLYKNKILDSKEFLNLLLNFDEILIQLEYPSESFNEIYSIVSSIKNDNQSKKINVRPILTQYPAKETDYNLNQFNIDSIELGPLITIIKTKSFYKMDSLKEILIPSSVTTIESEAFSECSSLMKISIPNSVTKIEKGAFKDCSSLEEVSIPSSINVIESNTFTNCKTLKQVSIPDSVSKIEDNAFYECSSLDDLKIPSSVKSIGNSSFGKCTSLQKISMLKVESIGDYAFSDCIALQGLKFSSKLKSINEYAFSGCKSLKYLFVPFSVEKIGNNAFDQCTSLELISLPKSTFNKELNINAKAKVIYTKDHSDSYYQFGNILFRGDKVTMNKKEGISFYKMAINKGNEQAMYTYGDILFNGDGVEVNKDEGIKYFKMAADKGNKDAMFSYANILFKGNGVPIDKKESIKYYKMAVDKGHQQAMNNYGNILFYGKGVPMNKKEGIKYYNMAIEKGNIIAMFNFANILYKGIGVPVNKEEGIKLYKMAASKGHEEAMFIYGMKLFSGDGIKMNVSEGLSFIKKSADLGNSNAMFNYGKISFTGEKVPVNKEVGIKYYKMSAEKGNSSAMTNYGIALIEGDGVHQNKQEGLNYLKMAIQKGNTNAMVRYADHLIKGDGVSKNLLEANRYYKIAADKGNELAREKMQSLNQLSNTI